jgi:hypothetical protein
LSNAAIAGEFMHRAYDNGLIYDFDRLCREAGKPVLQNRPGFNLSN